MPLQNSSLLSSRIADRQKKPFQDAMKSLSFAQDQISQRFEQLAVGGKRGAHTGFKSPLDVPKVGTGSIDLSPKEESRSPWLPSGEDIDHMRRSGSPLDIIAQYRYQPDEKYIETSRKRAKYSAIGDMLHALSQLPSAIGGAPIGPITGDRPMGAIHTADAVEQQERGREREWDMLELQTALSDYQSRADAAIKEQQWMRDQVVAEQRWARDRSATVEDRDVRQEHDRQMLMQRHDLNLLTQERILQLKKQYGVDSDRMAIERFLADQRIERDRRSFEYKMALEKFRAENRISSDMPEPAVVYKDPDDGEFYAFDSLGANYIYRELYHNNPEVREFIEKNYNLRSALGMKPEDINAVVMEFAHKLPPEVRKRLRMQWSLDVSKKVGGDDPAGIYSE